MDAQLKKLLASLSIRQRIIIAAVVLAAGSGIYSLVHWRREADFKPLFSGLASEDAAAIVQKLKEGGVEYRLAEGAAGAPATVLVPSARLAELRLSMAAAGIPKSGRIGYELFDRNNLGATEFTEHINYRRALEGELERSVMSLAEVDQARVHITFPKESVYLEAQQPAKASVLVRLKPGAHLAPQNVVAINHLVASAVEGLAPDAVSVLDMNGNLLGRPRLSDPDGNDPPAAVLEYRHREEADLLSKINTTLEPLLGPDKFRAGVSVDCDFSAGDQSEEVYDPAKTVMVTSQRSEDSTGASSTSGVPGTPSNLPRPSSRAGGGSSRVSRVSENITYQSSRVVKKTHVPAGVINKISVAIVVDQALTWERDKAGFHRLLTPPSPEKLKVIHDLVAGVTGLNIDRGDQLVVESQPFESTLSIEAPPGGGPAAAPGEPVKGPARLLQLKWDRKTLLIAVGALLAILCMIGGVVAVFLRRMKQSRKKAQMTGLAELGVPDTAALAEQNALEEAKVQKEAEAKVLSAFRVTPVITKTAELMAKHLRERITQEPEVSAHVLRTWIREEELL
ncbi:MAG: flagellar M-ring protein FliF [Acidobacteriia bacterium]|nr:flagellar M-ring protein FliF [Terriglobia bacterium]